MMPNALKISEFSGTTTVLGQPRPVAFMDAGDNSALVLKVSVEEAMQILTILAGEGEVPQLVQTTTPAPSPAAPAPKAPRAPRAPKAAAAPPPAPEPSPAPAPEEPEDDMAEDELVEEPEAAPTPPPAPPTKPAKAKGAAKTAGANGTNGVHVATQVPTTTVDVPQLPAAIRGTSAMRDLLVYLVEDAQIPTVDELVQVCLALKESVPVLSKVPDIDSRVRRAATALDLFGSGDEAAEIVE